MLKFEEIISKFQIEGEITDVKPLGPDEGRQSASADGKRQLFPFVPDDLLW